MTEHAEIGLLFLNDNETLSKEKEKQLKDLGVKILHRKTDARLIADANMKEQIRSHKRRLYYSKPDVKQKRKDYYDKPEVKQKRTQYSQKEEVKNRKKLMQARKALLIKEIREKNSDLYNAVMTSDVNTPKINE